ncbi:MAG: dipeptide epimerase [Anaerolineae bacterium]|nr:dipeptide epimerase [Anaerolineae bacterium]
MQITKVDVTPVELSLRQPIRAAYHPEIESVTAVFVRIETRQGESAWGCTVAHPDLTGEEPEDVIAACQSCADLAPDLHPTNIEYSLAKLSPLTEDTPAALCAFDLAFHDLLGLAAGMPLHRLLGGYRHRIQTSVTIGIAPLEETVEVALARAAGGFRMLKIKGGVNAGEDVRRVQAVHRALPEFTLRLDADGGYSVEQALDVARALEGNLEMLEQPTPADDLEALRQVTRHSPVPILAAQSVTGPPSALEVASHKAAHGINVKVAACGGLSRARQVDAIARAGKLATMIGCLPEPALLIAAGLSMALSAPNVRYCDLDGHLDLIGDPTVPGFKLEQGWLTATDVPGLGCTVDL